MKSLIYGLLLALLLWYVNGSFGTLAAVGMGVAILLVFIWIRRAALLTHIAVQAYYIKGDAGTSRVMETYILRKDEAGRWKILGWKEYEGSEWE